MEGALAGLVANEAVLVLEFAVIRIDNDARQHRSAMDRQHRTTRAFFLIRHAFKFSRQRRFC